MSAQVSVALIWPFMQITPNSRMTINSRRKSKRNLTPVTQFRYIALKRSIDLDIVNLYAHVTANRSPPTDTFGQAVILTQIWNKITRGTLVTPLHENLTYAIPFADSTHKVNTYALIK